MVEWLCKGWKATPTLLLVLSNLFLTYCNRFRRIIVLNPSGNRVLLACVCLGKVCTILKTGRGCMYVGGIDRQIVDGLIDSLRLTAHRQILLLGSSLAVD